MRRASTRQSFPRQDWTPGWTSSTVRISPTGHEDRGSRAAFAATQQRSLTGFAAVRRDHLWRIQDTIYPSIVIEQGSVQLWGFYIRDSSRYLPEEAYEVLSCAGVYPSDLASEDERAAKPWSRFLAGFGSSQKFPDRIDISETGQQALDFTPSEPIQL